MPAEFLRTLVEQGRDNGLPTSIFSLGDPHRLETPGIVCIKAGDGHHFPRHCHDCERFEVVLDGGFTDGTGHHYRAGDVMIAHHMDMYGPHIADPGGYVVLEYFGSVLGTYELFWDTKRGPFKANKIEEEHGVRPSTCRCRASARRRRRHVERGASFQSIHDPAFWNHVPAPYLQPLVDACLPYEGMAYRMFALGDPNDPETPAVTIFKAPPGYVLPRHSHDCHRFEVVLDGSLTDEHGDVLTAGSIATAVPGPDVRAERGRARRVDLGGVLRPARRHLRDHVGDHAGALVRQPPRLVDRPMTDRSVIVAPYEPEAGRAGARCRVGARRRLDVPVGAVPLCRRAARHLVGAAPVERRRHAGRRACCVQTNAGADGIAPHRPAPAGGAERRRGRRRAPGRRRAGRPTRPTAPNRSTWRSTAPASAGRRARCCSSPAPR